MSNSIVTLDNWSVSVEILDPFKAPEQQVNRVSGTVRKTFTNAIGATFQAGERITIGTVVSARGRVLTTKSGSRYKLGVISESYLKWMNENNIPYNSVEPIKVKVIVD
jgi:hypothetical protein